MGAILKDRVEKHMEATREPIQTALTTVLGQMEYDVDLFVSLLESYPARLTAVRAARGGHIKY